jgi:hypothetical protein
MTLDTTLDPWQAGRQSVRASIGAQKIHRTRQGLTPAETDTLNSYAASPSFSSCDDFVDEPSREAMRMQSEARNGIYLPQREPAASPTTINACGTTFIGSETGAGGSPPNHPQTLVNSA